MKKLLVTMMASLTLASAQAQLFSPEAFGGALWGSLIGGLAGGDCYNGFSGEGAAIGAGIGLLTGALAGEARRNEYYSDQPVLYTPAPTVNLGYGYVDSSSSAYVYHSPNAYTAPGYYYRPTRPNYAVSGTLLGAASGALIGSGYDDAGKGAAIGAAAGLVLGSVAELASKKQSQEIVTVQTTPAPVTQTPRTKTPDAKPDVTSEPCATSTYTWTPRPQIADAPRVPDAPTF